LYGFLSTYFIERNYFMDTIPPVDGQAPVSQVPPVSPVVQDDPGVTVSQLANQVVMPGSSVQYAGFGIRFAAVIIDAIILGIISGIVGGVLGGFGAVLSQGSDMGVLLMSMLGNLVGLVISLSYYIGMLVYHDGATIGKMIVHIKVVSVDGQPITLGKAIIRETIGKWISSIVLCLGYITVAFDAKKQGWHDKIAGTYVIYNR
jgi:uncharacterized RDD family membrane protein YckC